MTGSWFLGNGTKLGKRFAQKPVDEFLVMSKFAAWHSPSLSDELHFPSSILKGHQAQPPLARFLAESFYVLPLLLPPYQ